MGAIFSEHSSQITGNHLPVTLFTDDDDKKILRHL